MCMTGYKLLLCLVDFGVMENSLLSFMAIFLPAISSYMADKYSSGRSLLSLIPRFILMYCSFVILFFTYINREVPRKCVTKKKCKTRKHFLTRNSNTEVAWLSTLVIIAFSCLFIVSHCCVSHQTWSFRCHDDCLFYFKSPLLSVLHITAFCPNAHRHTSDYTPTSGQRACGGQYVTSTTWKTD